MKCRQVNREVEGSSPGWHHLPIFKSSLSRKLQPLSFIPQSYNTSYVTFCSTSATANIEEITNDVYPADPVVGGYMALRCFVRGLTLEYPTGVTYSWTYDGVIIAGQNDHTLQVYGKTFMNSMYEYYRQSFNQEVLSVHPPVHLSLHLSVLSARLSIYLSPHVVFFIRPTFLMWFSHVTLHKQFWFDLMLLCALHMLNLTHELRFVF